MICTKNVLNKVIGILLLAICLPQCFAADEPVVVDSIESLTAFLDRDAVKVKLKPGVYTVSDESIGKRMMLKKYKDGEPKIDYPVSSLLNFSGNGSKFIFDDTVINIDTRLHRSYGNTHLFEVFVSGNNNTIKGLTVKDAGAEIPVRSVIMMHVMGDNNTIIQCRPLYQRFLSFRLRPSSGKGGNALVDLHKHSSLLVTGRSNKLIGCKVVTHASVMVL